MSHGVSAITVDYNEEHNRVQTRIKIDDKWLDLLMTKMEAVEFANLLLKCQAQVDSSVETKPIQVYDKVDEPNEKTPYDQAVERQQAKPNLAIVEEAESGNLI